MGKRIIIVGADFSSVSIGEDDRPLYNLSVTVTGGNHNAPSTIREGSNVVFYIVPFTGKTYPNQEDISITNAQISDYNSSTGRLVINNAIGNVTILVTCPNEVVEGLLVYDSFQTKTVGPLQGQQLEFGNYTWGGPGTQKAEVTEDKTVIGKQGFNILNIATTNLPTHYVVTVLYKVNAAGTIAILVNQDSACENYINFQWNQYNGKFELVQKYINANQTPLASKAQTLTTGEHTMKLEVNNDVYTGYFDGELIGSGTPTKSLGGYTYIAMYWGGTNNEVLEFKVEEL
jgi:hypothetical protein